MFQCLEKNIFTRMAMDSPALFPELVLPAASLFAFELMPGISSMNRQQGLRLNYFCRQLFPLPCMPVIYQYHAMGLAGVRAGTL